jgi:hypothetical protein
LRLIRIIRRISLADDLRAESKASLKGEIFGVGVNSIVGWSSNYGMRQGVSYERDGPAQIISLGPFLRLGRSTQLRLGYDCTAIQFWDTEVDSSFFTSTGVVTFKDTRLTKNYGSLTLGFFQGVPCLGSQLAWGVQVHRPTFPLFHVKDFIDHTRWKLFEDAHTRGFDYEISFSLERRLASKFIVSCGYGLYVIRTENFFESDRQYIPNVHSWGTFHCIKLSCRIAS